ncbi:aminotransferase class IV family protein [Lentzea sp. NPDC005914]|uniref:aminotransferase class IV family protein n=1 Tax=Lentzea sp. NPDC005914 TaxID=3154572 RepID=UPI0033E01443
MDLNGTPATIDQMKVLALTNYGHFTSMLVESGAVRGLSLHMARLARDCRLLFDHDLDTDQVRGYVRKALGEYAGGRVVVRVSVFDPALDLGTIGRDARPYVLVTHREAASGTPAPWRLQAAAYQRDMPAVKHVGLFGSMQRRRAAQREGYDDVLFLNPDGTISEVATSNIGFVREGRIVWPRSAYLAGITMTLLHQELDEQIETEALTLSDLPRMDAAFATNAATGVRAVSSIDATEWPSEAHPVLKELRELYADIPAEPV